MIIAFALAALAPLSAALSAPENPVTYDEALACGFLGMGYGMRNDIPREEGTEALAIAVRYIEEAGRLSGKSQDEVVDDMSEMGSTVVAEIRASANPATELLGRWRSCASRAAELPEQD